MTKPKLYLTKIIYSKGFTCKSFAYAVGMEYKRIWSYYHYHDFNDSEKVCIAKILGMEVNEIFNDEYIKERRKIREYKNKIGKNYRQKKKNNNSNVEKTINGKENLCISLKKN